MPGTIDLSKEPPLVKAWLAFLVAWAIVSLILVLKRKGSEEAPKDCNTSWRLIMRYSPPWWRTFSRWVVPPIVILGIVYGVVSALLAARR